MSNFKCSGDCLKCSVGQRAYCASQFTYNSMRMIEHMQGTIEEMRLKIESLQNSEADIFDPTKENMIPKSVSASEDTAQSGDGAEE